MENELAIVDTQNLSPQEIRELDKEVTSLVERHKDNRYEINRLVFESMLALTAGDKLTKDKATQGFFKRLGKNITGNNNKTQNDINADLVKAQYAAQLTLQKLAEQNALSFELIAAVNNKLNASMLAVNTEINNIYATLLTFFQKTRAEIVQLGVTVAQHEKDIKLLKWKGAIKYQLYKGCAYKKLDTITKIVCLTRDFYEINEGTWSTADLLLLETALADVGLEPEKEINLRDFIGQVSNDSDLNERLLAGTGQFATENEEIAFALRQPDLPVPDAAVTCYEFVLELLYNLRQLEYNKTIHEKLQAAKELFLSYKLKEALPLLEETTDAGKDEARYMLSVLYKEGFAVEKNPERATALLAGTVAEDYPDELKRAADGGEVFAQYELAQYHLREAVKYLKQSADQNYFLAAYELGLMYYAGVGVEKNYDKAKECFELSADMGHSLSMAYLGDIYFELYDVIDSFESSLKTIEYYEEARAHGFYLSDARFEILKKAAERIRGYSSFPFISYDSRYETNIRRIVSYYFDRDQKIALKWALLGESNGDHNCAFHAGLIYYSYQNKDSGIERNYELAIKYFKRAIELYKTFGLYDRCIAKLYLEGGYGVTADRAEARKWMERAAAKGDAELFSQRNYFALNLLIQIVIHLSQSRATVTPLNAVFGRAKRASSTQHRAAASQTLPTPTERVTNFDSSS